ncbi:hypothetical protein UFOVP314_39 [uncultured Caudovirales phage]|uniref:Uncharacterized protein n=1 Tax=uncultured Caudovirales phage TaxID=2100421 RepID=A0A6J5LV67_9CAUD|nr:hypothetical protein UFOVP314_39 [uncultured Caudovirales phage]
MASRPAPVPAPVEDPEVPQQPVRARWIDTQPVFVPAQAAIVRYGDEIWVTPEQLASPNQPTIPWSDDWVADPELAAIAAKEG